MHYSIKLSKSPLKKLPAPWGVRIARILAAALQAVEPKAAVARHMHRNGDALTIHGRTYDLKRIKRVLIVGAGKAGAPMAHAAAQILGKHLTQGVVIVKEGYRHDDWQSEKISILEAGHPIPDERGVQGTQRIIQLLEDTKPDDLILCLISGGGSALLTSPAHGLDLADLQSVTTDLLACGANINEINTLRKHLDQVKGGGLARLAFPAKTITLILSDVVGNPLDVIASGPTVPDTTTFNRAHAIIEQYNLLDRVPGKVIRILNRGSSGEYPETPKPGDPVFANLQNVIIGSNLLAAEAAVEQAKVEGFHTLLLTTYLQGEARQVGRVLAAVAKQIAENGQPLPRPACVITGGETTVTLRGSGLGGRNQEMALSAVTDLAGLSNVAVVTLATDGGDGPTDAAGAVVTGQTLERARQAGIDPIDHLTRNDSYNFFAPLGDLLKPGPTFTNVNDLAFLFAY